MNAAPLAIPFWFYRSPALCASRLAALARLRTLEKGLRDRWWWSRPDSPGGARLFHPVSRPMPAGRVAWAGFVARRLPRLATRALKSRGRA